MILTTSDAPQQVVEVENRTPGAIEVGIEPLAAFYRLEGAATLTIRTTFTATATRLEVIRWRSGISCWLFGPTLLSLPDGSTDDLYSVAGDDAPALPRSILLSNETDAVMRLRVGVHPVLEIAHGHDRGYDVTSTGRALRLTVDERGVLVSGWELSPAEPSPS
jgi:hypothetical protein